MNQWYATNSPSTPDFHNSTACTDQLGYRVRRALVGTGCAPLQQVEVLVDEGVVSLVGQVPTYYMKQLAQTVAMNVDGVKSLNSKLTVC